MLKLNSTGGKLDITINDDTLFGTGRKVAVKPHKGIMVARPSHPPGKQEAKPMTVGLPDKGINTKQSRNMKQEKLKTKQVKKPRASSRVAAAKKEQIMPHDAAGVITQANFEHILSLLNIEGLSAGKRLSPEHISQLMTSLGKNNAEELKGMKELNKKPADNILDGTRKQSRNLSGASKPEEKKQERKNQTDNTTQVHKEDTKLQWKKELDEQILLQKKAENEEKHKQVQKLDEYNPWGRPGAGAPIRNQSGKVMADYYHRASKEHNEIPKSENIPGRETIPVSLGTSSHSPGIVYQSRPNPVATVAPSTSDAETTLPVAMRSSFAVGAPGLVAHDTQHKRIQELQWKQELEKQIEEKKEREKQRKLKEDQEDFLNLSWNTKHLRQPLQQLPKNTAQPQHTHDYSSRINEQIDKKPSQDMAPQGTQDGSFLNASLNGSLKTHARGFGMQSMDPHAKEDAEKRRLKMLEHQRAIQEQVEEKRRIKQQEREQRLKEEATEEARYAKERETLNQTFISEQKKKREKEEEAKRVSEALQQSVIDAYQASLLAKADKRRRRMDAAGKDTQGATTSRSYVVSQATLDAQHVHADRVRSIPSVPRPQHDYNRSVLSNYESPRVTERKTNRSIGGTSQDKEPFVPPLNLTRGVSPPVPTLRKNMAVNSDPNSTKSYRAVFPPATKSNLHRTVSSYSEPSNGSLALSSNNRVTNESYYESLSSSRVLSYDGEFIRPFSTLEDAFMIPYHRTDSATLPARPETPESNASQEMSSARQIPMKVNKTNAQKHLRNAPPNNGKTIAPMYRTASSYLKAEVTQPEVSPRRAKGTKGVQGRHESQVSKATASPRGVNKASQKEITKKPLRKSTNTQPRGKELERRVTKDHVTPRNNASSVLSTHREVPEPLPTARQEMILQQLAALRQGLIIKERELKQDANMHL